MTQKHYLHNELIYLIYVINYKLKFKIAFDLFTIVFKACLNKLLCY